MDKYAKAIVSGLFAAFAMYTSVRSGGVSADEWVSIVMTALGATGFVWAVPNAGAPTPVLWAPTTAPAPVDPGPPVTGE